MLSISLFGVIAVALAVLLLGLVTFLNNSRRAVNRVFAWMCGLSSVYVVVNFFADVDKTRALFWYRSTFALAALIIYMIVAFVDIFPRQTINRKWEITLGAIAVLMAGVSFLPDFISGLVVHADGTDVVAGPLYSSFPVFLLGFSLIIIYIITLSLRRTSGIDRERTRYVAAGLVVTLLLTATTNLFLPLIQGNDQFSFLGSYFMLIFFGASSFSIVRHRLFNVRLIVARSLAYLLLLATLATTYALLAFSISSWLFPEGTLSLAQNIFYVVMAVILAFTFQPLKRFFERLTDSIFFRDRYDSQEVLNELSTILINEFNLDDILKGGLKQLCERLHLQSGQFYIFNENKVYKVEHYGPLPKRLAVAPELMHLKKNLLVADETEGGMAKEIMDSHGIRLALRLSTRDKFVGFLLLGDKLNGDIYSEQDIDLLQIAGKEIAVAISNAKAYEEIAEFNITLQDKVEQATKRLRTANRHLKELDEAKDEFISMASHQLRTPLTSIKGYVSMLMEGDAGKLEPQQKEFLGYAYSGTNRMVALISDLLNVSRMQAGRFMIERAPIDLDAVVAEETSNLQTHAQPKGLKLSYVPPKSKLPLANLDENKTRQVIMNFIDNAIYYTKQGSVTVSLDKVGGAIEMRVKDTGIGVPKEAQSKLFHKFFRADNAQGVRPDGTGLGLYLAKRVVEDQGGSIIFETAEGKGSTFGFTFPLSAIKITEAVKPKEVPVAASK
jgi:signal transduction histidine kinase